MFVAAALVAARRLNDVRIPWATSKLGATRARGLLASAASAIEFGDQSRIYFARFRESPPCRVRIRLCSPPRWPLPASRLGVDARADEPPVYEVYAVRYATWPDFPVANLVVRGPTPDGSSTSP